jgi:hypothetical protein
MTRTTIECFYKSKPILNESIAELDDPIAGVEAHAFPFSFRLRGGTTIVCVRGAVVDGAIVGRSVMICLCGFIVDVVENGLYASKLPDIPKVAIGAVLSVTRWMSCNLRRLLT